jgi:hypothetical protein
MGFRKKRKCTDAICTLRQLVEKNIEYNRNIFVTFVDQEKVFDRVDINILWKTLEQYGVNANLINICKSLYSKCRIITRTKKGTSKPFEVTSGVRQGCVLSPLLFTTYIDNFKKKAHLQYEDIKDLLFADDQALIAYEETEFQGTHIHEHRMQK